MSSFLRSFDQYWQESANTSKKLVAPKYKRKAVVLNFSNKNIQEVKFNPPEPEEIIEERACILASDIGLPFEWAEAVVKLRNIKTPKNITTTSWLEMKKVCAILYADNFTLLRAIIVHGWSLYDVYGCSLINPYSSFDKMGLLLLLKPTDRIIEVIEGRIKIRSKSGNTSSFYPKLEQRLKTALLHELV